MGSRTGLGGRRDPGRGLRRPGQPGLGAGVHARFTAAIGAASALALLGGLRRSQWSPTLGVTALPLDVLPRGDSIELLRRYRPDLAANDPAWTPSFMSRATCRWLCTSRAVTCARIAPR
ncbi:MAG TPA: hypothetical protein VOB72_15005 [Candidatus Dormibacteraeota bacterium]|nr:hypothetical protein [Candidatus Dormibacteraeota bacterium]